MMETQKKSIRELLEPVLPPILFRNHPKFKEWTGISPRTVANMDSIGTGPDDRLIVAHVCGYPKDSFLRWLESRTRREIGR
jgi:hypothetical protein